jgi:hypothetical protein
MQQPANSSTCQLSITMTNKLELVGRKLTHCTALHQALLHVSHSTRQDSTTCRPPLLLLLCRANTLQHKQLLCFCC